MNGVRLTRRGKFVVVVLILLAVALFTYATRDTCWVGETHGNAFGYGKCSALYDYRTEVRP